MPTRLPQPDCQRSNSARSGGRIWAAGCAPRVSLLRGDVGSLDMNERDGAAQDGIGRARLGNGGERRVDVLFGSGDQRRHEAGHTRGKDGASRRGHSLGTQSNGIEIVTSKAIDLEVDEAGAYPCPLARVTGRTALIRPSSMARRSALPVTGSLPLTVVGFTAFLTPCWPASTARTIHPVMTLN